jgi:thymidylate kinase
VALHHRLRGRLVVWDRHAWDARLPSERTQPRARVRRWVLAHAALSPQLCVVLDADAEVLHRRSGEHDVPWLDRQRQAYLDLARRLGDAVVVDAHADPDLVRREVTAAVWRRYGDVWGRRGRRRGR